MAEKSDTPLEEVLARQQLDLDRLKDALALLGVSACSWCKKFLRRSDPGSLFDAGELVCYGCIHGGGRSAAFSSTRKSARMLKVSWSSGCATTIMPNYSRTRPSCRRVLCRNCTLWLTAWNAGERENWEARNAAAIAMGAGLYG